MGHVITIRPAVPADAAALAALAGQFGYPTTDEEARRRLTLLARLPDDVVWVAETPGHEVIGWLHASRTVTLVADVAVEVRGLVVDEGHRSQGVGARLMEAAEAWARTFGARSVNLRSNVLRGEAHRFYERLGYEEIKRQATFRRDLP